MTPARSAPDNLSGGFADPPVDSAFAFRSVLTALSKPGHIATVTGAMPPAPLSVAAGVTVLTLIDGTTPLHLAGRHDCAAVRSWIAFHTGAPLVGAEDAVFAVGSWQALAPLDRFSVGTPDYPDRSATLIVEMADVAAIGARLTGPGIRAEVAIALPDIAAFQSNRRLFPQGLDFLLTDGSRIAGLPRSAIAEAV